MGFSDADIGLASPTNQPTATMPKKVSGLTDADIGLPSLPVANSPVLLSDQTSSEERLTAVEKILAHPVVQNTVKELADPKNMVNHLINAVVGKQVFPDIQGTHLTEDAIKGGQPAKVNPFDLVETAQAIGLDKLVNAFDKKPKAAPATAIPADPNTVTGAIRLLPGQLIDALTQNPEQLALGGEGAVASVGRKILGALMIHGGTKEALAPEATPGQRVSGAAQAVFGGLGAKYEPGKGPSGVQGKDVDTSGLTYEERSNIGAQGRPTIGLLPPAQPRFTIKPAGPEVGPFIAGARVQGQPEVPVKAKGNATEGPFYDQGGTARVTREYLEGLRRWQEEREGAPRTKEYQEPQPGEQKPGFLLQQALSQPPRIMSGLEEATMAGKPPVEEAGGKISFAAPAEAGGIPNARQTALESSTAKIDQPQAPQSPWRDRVSYDYTDNINPSDQERFLSWVSRTNDAEALRASYAQWEKAPGYTVPDRMTFRSVAQKAIQDRLEELQREPEKEPGIPELPPEGGEEPITIPEVPPEEKDTLRAHLKNVAVDKKSKFRQMAAYLMRIGDEAGLKVRVSKKDLHPSIGGHYRGGPDDIEIQSFLKGEDFNETLIHEATHALTLRKLPDNIVWSYKMGDIHTKALNDYLKSGKDPNVKTLIETYFEALKARKPEDFGRYGLKDLQEHLAEAWSNPEYQRFLQRTPAKTGGTLWQKLVSAVKRMLGLPISDNLLGKTLQASHPIIEAKRGQWPGVSKEVSGDVSKMPTVGSEGPSEAVRAWAEKKFGNKEAAKNFSNWFKGSKIVNNKGEPIQLYHGTPNPEFTKFRTTGAKASSYQFGEGAYLTAAPDRAAGYAGARRGGVDKKTAYSGAMYPVYASIKNPYVTDTTAATMDIGSKLSREQPDVYKSIAQDLVDDNGYTDINAVGTAEVGNRWLRQQGYDGIVYHYFKNPNDFYEVLAFHPDQVKSAIGNSGEFNPFSPDIMHSGIPMPASINKVTDTVLKYIRSRPLKETMSYYKDATSNLAAQAANESASRVEGMLQRTFPNAKVKQGSVERNSLLFMREAQEDRGTLLDFKKRLEAATGPDIIKGDRADALLAINFALHNFDKLRNVSKEYEKLIDKEADMEEASGRKIERRKGYVMHLAEDTGDATSFTHAREFDTMVDRILAGHPAGSFDSVELMRSRVARGQQVFVQQKIFLNNLRKLTDASGNPIIGKYIEVSRGPGKPVDKQPPKGYVDTKIGLHTEPVLKEYADTLHALTDPSFFMRSASGKAVMEARGVTKHLLLGFDTYHLLRLMSYSMASKVSTGHVPSVRHNWGITVLDNTVKELQDRAAAGQIDPKELPQMLEAKRIMDLAVKTGFNVNRVIDVFNQHWTEHIPLTGHFQKWLFNTFQRGAMADVYVKAFDAYKKQMPTASEGQVARKLSHDLNAVFGTLGRQGWIKSRTGQDIAQMLFLAPQWTEGRIRTDLGAMSGVAKAGMQAAKLQRPEFNMQSRVVGTLILTTLVANQAINVMTKGHSTFENEEGHRLDAFIPDKLSGGPGYWLNPTANAEEVFHAMHRSMQREGGDIWQAWLDFVNGKLSTLTRPLAVGITGRKYGMVGPYVDEPSGKKAPYGGPSGKAKFGAALGQVIQPPIGSAETMDMIRGKMDRTSQQQIMSRFGMKVDPNVEKKPKDKKRQRKYSVFSE